MKIHMKLIWLALICIIPMMTASCKTQHVDKESVSALTVVSTRPIQGASGVKVDSDITITFSESVLMNGRTQGRIFLDDDRYMDIHIVGKTVQGTPSVNWPYSSTVPISVVKNLFRSQKNGVRLAENYQFTFHTEDDPTAVPPEIISVSPANGSTSVPVDTAFIFTFDQPIDTKGFAQSNLDLGNGITAAVSFNAAHTSITATPLSPLPYNRKIRFTIPRSQVVSEKGVHMDTDYVYGFETKQDPMAVPPQIVGASPDNGSTDVSVDAIFTFTFDQPMDTKGFTQSTLDLGDGIKAEVMFNAAHTSVTFMPVSPLPYNRKIQFTIPRNYVISEKGMHMETDYLYGFETEGDPTAVPPQIIATTPANGAVDVPVDGSMTITFSDPIETSGLTSVTIDVGGNMQIHITFNDDMTTATLTPSDNLPYRTTISFTIPADAVVSKKGISMAADYAFTFTTEPAPMIQMDTMINDLAAIDAAGYLYSLNRNKSISIISTDRKEIDMTVAFPSWLKNFSGIPVSMSFDSSRHRLYVLCRYSGMIASYDTDTDAFIQSETIYYTFLANGIDMEIDPLRRRLYVVYSETDLFLNVYYYLSIIDPETRDVLETTTIENPVSCLSLDKTSRFVYLLGDTDTGTYITKFSVARDTISEIKTVHFSDHTGNMALNGDGTILAVPSGNTITAFDQNLEDMGAWNVGERVTCVQYSPDTTRLYAATGADRMLFLDAEERAAAPISSHPFPNAFYGAILSPEAMGRVVTGFSYDEQANDEYTLYFFEEQ